MSDRAAILHLIDSFGMGGAQQRYFNDLRFLGGPFEHQALAVFGSPADAPQQGEPKRALHSLGLTNVRDLPEGIVRLTALLRRDRSIRLIHTQLFGADTIGRIAGRLCRCEVVSTVQSAIYEPESGLYSRWRHRTDQMTSRLATRVIAVSEFVRGSVHRRLGLPLDRITVIPNAVDASSIHADPARRLATRIALGLGPEPFVWLTVGRLHAAKGLACLMGALARLVSTKPATVLVLAGGGPYLRPLQERAAALGVTDRVRFLGDRTDVLALLDAADAFVFPSLSEGLPFAPLEAMAMGKACVLSRIGPHEELVESGISGMLVRPGDEGDLAAGMARLQDDADFRQRLGTRGEAEVRARYDARACALQLQHLYETILNQPSS